MQICVFGAASNQIDPTYIIEGEKVGEELAKRGHTLVFGAGDNGMMGAVARGAKRAGGPIYGVIPTFFREEEIEAIFSDCTELIFTETMADRKDRMAELSDAFVVLPGGIGTFEEFFQFLTLKQLGRHQKPIAVYDINGYYEHLETMLLLSTEQGFITDSCKHLYHYCNNTPDLFRYLEGDCPKIQDVHELKLG